MKINKYGLEWTVEDEPQIDLAIIQKGGSFVYDGSDPKMKGKKIGLGLFHHFKEFESLVWPDDDHHRWSDLILKTALENDVIGILGPGDAGKTYPVAKWILVDYFSHPNETLTVVCTTEERGAEQRIFGAIKQLLVRAQVKFPWLPGKIIDSENAITTDDLKKDKARSMSKGIVWVPCKMRSNDYSHVRNFVGFKQKRMRLVADEAQFLGSSFLDALANYWGKGSVKAFVMGNPVDPMDCLGQACEPLDGWETHPEPTKTTTWPTKWQNGICINFYGLDSPNFDYPENEPTKYDYMVGWKKMRFVEHKWKRDSIHWYSQVLGVMRSNITALRVLTMQLCRNNKAFEDVLWKDGKLKRIYFLDAAYSGLGGDRCVGGYLDFGECVDGIFRIKVGKLETLFVNVRLQMTPEDQIAGHIFQKCNELGIAGTDIFYDDTGRGSLGAAFARKFGFVVPVPVPFGGRPSTRPVRHDLKKLDPKKSTPRHIQCDEYYSKFVTELWFSVRYVIECDQMRSLPEDVAREGCMRCYKMVAGNKIEVEPKDEVRERLGSSPDLFDALATGIEGARQRGFQIRMLATVTNDGSSRESSMKYLEELAGRQRRLMESKQLKHV